MVDQRVNSRKKLNVYAPGRGDIGEVLLGDPSVPMCLKLRLRYRLGLVRAERPFVDDGAVTGVVKQAWGDPRLIMH